MPPRAKRNQKKEPTAPDELSLTKRLFVERSRISKHLTCSICMDVFSDPVMPATCQHTFCRKCLASLAANSRTASTPCPYCRKTFKLASVKINILAASLINELDIYCSNRSVGCAWKGEIQRIPAHLKICSYGKEKLPQWLADHRLNIEKEEEALELLEDEDRDLQLEESTKPLAMRLFKPIEDGNDKTDKQEAQLMNEQLSKIVTGGMNPSPGQQTMEETKYNAKSSPEGNDIFYDLRQVQKDLFND